MTQVVPDHPEHQTLPAFKPFRYEEIEKLFGAVPTARIPDYPGVATLHKLDKEAPTVCLSKLPCGCLGLAEKATAQQLMDAMKPYSTGNPLMPAETTKMTAQQRLDDMLGAIRDGAQVTPKMLAEAREAVEIERISEEGRLEREAAEAAKQEHARREELAAPLRQAIRESEERLKAQYDEAHEILSKLLDAVSRHNGLVQETGNHLTEQGLDANLAVEGYTSRVDVNGTVFAYWGQPAWMANLLGALAEKYQIIGTSRWTRAVLPNQVPDGPRPRTDADA